MSTKELFLFFVIMVVRYAVIAGIAFLVFYVFFRKKFFRRKIQKLFPSNKDYTREIIYSLLTVLIFTGIAFLLESRYVKPHTRIYAHINDYGLLYFICSIPLALVIHDTYFYWTHRLMHHPGLFKLFHLTHHKSTNPSPWAAYAFNPFEAVVEGSVIFV